MLVFQYEKCRAESRGRTEEKQGEYSYRYGRGKVVSEASSTIMDSERGSKAKLNSTRVAQSTSVGQKAPYSEESTAVRTQERAAKKLDIALRIFLIVIAGTSAVVRGYSQRLEMVRWRK